MPKRNVTKKTLHTRVRRGIKNTVVPHKKNGYRPHLIRGTGIAVVVTVVVAAQLLSGLVPRGTILGNETDVTMERLLAATNEQRVRQGEAPLTLDQKLNYAATEKAHDMLAGQYWAHVSPSGATPWTWFKKAGYHYSYAGENLAKGFLTSSGVVTAWMNSTEHRDNVLNEHYTNVGFAVVNGSLDGESTNIIVALYGRPVAKTAVATGETVLAATDEPMSLAAHLGVALQSMSPAVLTSLLLTIFTIFIALTAHMYRKKLPKQVRQTWRRHHGLYKAVGMSSLAVVLLALYGGGQI
ncbi:hypothetical protein RAAC3_TM7C00001G0543 [Candidatus Saccharibacteria bacterium RAAC3_TM7_1]|nr:hypothetical protein RAAC3_TM7C00001G0543 [Candidatus Saccharibacteria bacterium RAAC3_TM7_1]HCZ28670.1 CAP domain-containing protein [Candidatus Saccharibacteria bacterium]